MGIMEKLAAELQAQQERVAKRIENGESILAAHSLGSGKTLTALESARRVMAKDPKAHVVALVPAPLVNNMDKEIDKHQLDIDKSRFHVMSYEKAMREGEKIHELKPKLLIMDEGHKGRNTGTDRTRFIRWAASNADQTLMMTATPSYNKASDVAVLVNTLAKKKILPEVDKDFENAFTYKTYQSPGFFKEVFLNKDPEESTHMRNQKVLQDILGNYIDFHDAAKANAADFPTKEESVVKVEMSPEQRKYYDYVEGQLPLALRLKVRSGMPMDKAEMKALNSFSTGVRQVSNTYAPYLKDESARESAITPKLAKMVEKLKEHHDGLPNFRGVVYSNYLDAGLLPYSKELKKLGIKHEIFDGSINDKKKKELIERYNNGDLPVLLVSSSGTEGLDLKGTKLIQVMEPHFNKEKINQVIGRGIRYKSHSHLPEKERKVIVEKYQTIMPVTKAKGFIEKNRDSLNSFFGMGASEGDKTIDEYLEAMAEDKKSFSDQILDEGRKGFENKYLQKVAEAMGDRPSLTKSQVNAIINNSPVESFLRALVPTAGIGYTMGVAVPATFLALRRLKGQPISPAQVQYLKDVARGLQRNKYTGKASIDPTLAITTGLGVLAGTGNYLINQSEAEKREKALHALGVDTQTGSLGYVSNKLTPKGVETRMKTLQSARVENKKPLVYWLQNLVNPPALATNLVGSYLDHKRNVQVDAALQHLRSHVYSSASRKADNDTGPKKLWSNFELQDESFYS